MTESKSVEGVGDFTWLSLDTFLDEIESEESKRQRRAQHLEGWLAAIPRPKHTYVAKQGRRPIQRRNQMLGKAEIESRLGFHKATIEGPDATLPKHTELRLLFKEFGNRLDEILPFGRAKSVAFTELENASMWSHKSVAELAPVIHEHSNNYIPESAIPSAAFTTIATIVKNALLEQDSGDPTIKAKNVTNKIIKFLNGENPNV
jgi:hypothetical protein